MLVYSTEQESSKRYKTRRYYLSKGVIKNFCVIINIKNFFDQPVDADVKRYKEKRNLTRKQGEHYTSGCLLDYEYIKNCFRLIAVDLSRQTKLDADPKGIQEIEIVGQLKQLDINGNATDVGNDQSMFVLMILEKIKEMRLTFSKEV